MYTYFNALPWKDIKIHTYMLEYSEHPLYTVYSFWIYAYIPVFTLPVKKTVSVWENSTFITREVLPHIDTWSFQLMYKQ